MSLSIDGVWKVDVWDQTVWADGVWREGAEKSYFYETIRYNMQVKITVDKTLFVDTMLDAKLSIGKTNKKIVEI